MNYFNISIDNVISTLPGLTVLSQCYNLDGSNPTYDPASSACRLVSRDAGGQLLTVATPYQNLGTLKTDGVELQGHWGLPMLEGRFGGKFYVDTALSWLQKYEVQLVPGAASTDYTGVSVGSAGPGAVPPRAAPDLRALTTLGFKGSAFGGGLRWRYQASMDDVTSVLTPSNAQVGVPAYSLWDLFLTGRFGEHLEVRGGVNNLFNKEPPFVASSQTGIDVALYDIIGRTYYVGLRASF